MIVITDIKYYNTNLDPVVITSSDSMFDNKSFFLGLDDLGEEVKSQTIKTELIYGTRFRRASDGEYIVVGASKDVQEVLGLMYESWQNMENDLTRLNIDVSLLNDNVWKKRNKIAEQKEFIDLILNGTLWQRIKYLFTKCF